MQDFSIISQIKDEPLALAVLGCMVILKIIDLIVKFAPKIFTKRKLSVEEIIARESKERRKWQDGFWKKIGEIETKVENLFSAVSVHEQFSSKVSEGTLVNQLFSDGLWPFLRLKAFRRLLAMGKNGRVWDKGFKLVLENKEAWLDVLDSELGLKIADAEYYAARIDEIRRRVLDGFSGKRGGAG